MYDGPINKYEVYCELKDPENYPKELQADKYVFIKHVTNVIVNGFQDSVNKEIFKVIGYKKI